MIKICKTCKKEFFIYHYRIKTAKFCSFKCKGKFYQGKRISISTEFKKGYIPWIKGKHPIPWNKGLKKGDHPSIGKTGYQKGHPFYKGGEKGWFKKGQFGEKSFGWKGGITKSTQGYIYIYQPSHPFPDYRKYIKRANLVMEQILGRYLTLKEVVHHKGIEYPISSVENRQDDRPENLQLFPNESEHQKFHHPKGIKAGFLEGQIAEVEKLTKRVKYDYSSDGREEERREVEAQKEAEQWRP